MKKNFTATPKIKTLLLTIHLNSIYVAPVVHAGQVTTNRKSNCPRVPTMPDLGPMGAHRQTIIPHSPRENLGFSYL